MGKSKRVKRHAKKSTETPVRGVVIRETLEMPLTKKKEKSMRDFHKTHPSGSGSVTKTTRSVAKIKPSATSEGTGVKPGVPDVAEEESSENNKLESDSEQETNESESGSESDHDESKENKEDDDDEDETKKTNKEGTDATMTNVQQGNKNPEILQVIEDTHVILSTIPQKTKVLVTSSSHSSNLAAKFLNFSDIPHIDAEIVSPLDVHVHHEVPSQQTPTLLIVPISVISDSLLVFSTVILQSLPSFTPPPQQSSPTPPPTTEATNPQSALLNFVYVFQFNNRVTTLEKEVVELKKDYTLKTQVIALIDEYVDARLAATRDEFINFLSASITAKITEQALATLIEFELQKILIDNMDKSESYLVAPEHRDSYEGLKKSYDLDKTFFSTDGKVYSLMRSQKDKDKDEDPSAGSKRGLKKRRTSKDTEPTKGPKAKESRSSSSKGDKSKSISFGKSVQLEEPEFEVVNSDIPHDQEENPDNDDEPKEMVASKHDWFT
nr:hypothetical protein [Tanacetum cinerariifolium]